MRHAGAVALAGLLLLCAWGAAAPAFAQGLTAPAAAESAACHATSGPLPDPALAQQFADPFVYCADGRFYVVASNWAGIHIPIASSERLDRWSVLRDEAGTVIDAMPELPAWVVRGRGVRPDIWAPTVARLNGRYVLYFSARHGSAKTPRGAPRDCIGAAVSDFPDHGFRPAPLPLVCGGFAEGVIDADVLPDGGRALLYFKSDGNCCGLSTNLYVVPLSADGLSLTGLISPVGVSNDREWEGEIVEAPSMIRHEGRYVLFYSGGRFDSAGYGVAYATCEGPVGPCQKPLDNRVLQSGHGRDGPGHQSVFEVDGRSFMAFHGLIPSAKHGADDARLLHVEPLDWSDGTPRIGGEDAASPVPPAPSTDPALQR